MLMLLLFCVSHSLHTARTADSYVGRLPPGYTKADIARINGRQKTPISKVKIGTRRLSVGGPIKTTFFVPDKAFGKHLDLAKMMENIFFGATSAIDPKALAKSAASIKAFFKGLKEMAKGYKSVAKIKNIRPRIQQAKEHIKARIKHLVPLDYFEVNNYDDVSSIAESENAETSFGGERSDGAADDTDSLGSEGYQMTEMVKGGFKAIIKTDMNMSLSDRVASARQKMKDLFTKKRGIIEDSVKHYGTRQVYNAIEQGLPKPNKTRLPNLSFEAISKDVRNELKEHLKNFTSNAWSEVNDAFRGSTRKPVSLRTRIRIEAKTIRKIRSLNDIDNILAYEDQKRKDKKFQAPVRV